jgi:hypothetical protein
MGTVETGTRSFKIPLEEFKLLKIGIGASAARDPDFAPYRPVRRSARFSFADLGQELSELEAAVQPLAPRCAPWL